MEAGAFAFPARAPLRNEAAAGSGERDGLPSPPKGRVRCVAVVAALLVAAKVWHFWLGVFQAIPFLLLVLVLGWLYVTKVLARKYPRQ